MHVHAHLFTNEVIGFAAGYSFTDKYQAQCIYVQDVYPVKPLEDTGMDRAKSVEMDPESSAFVIRLAESRNQTILGWYHSHPVFDTNPSKIDI